MNAQTNRTLVIFALVAALGVLSVQVVDLVLFLEAEAKGCPITSRGVNASQGRCFGHGPAVQSADEATVKDQVADDEVKGDDEGDNIEDDEDEESEEGDNIEDDEDEESEEDKNDE